MTSLWKTIKQYFNKQLYDDYYEVENIFEDDGVLNLVKHNKLNTIRQLLLDNRLNVNEVIFKITGHTLLHESIVMNRYEIFILAMKYKPNLDVKDSLGMTPLIKAVNLGRDRFVKELVENGADIEIEVGEPGQNAIDKAVLYDQFEILEYLQNKLDQKYNERL